MQIQEITPPEKRRRNLNELKKVFYNGASQNI